MNSNFNLIAFTDTYTSFSHILCNPPSIMATFLSNHTLQKLLRDEYRLPEDVRSPLHLNPECSKSQAARLKIIKTHSCEGFITQPFVSMKLQVSPYAIASGRSDELNGRFYGFLRSMPVLFVV
mmetsp:Transcript_23529/g.50820  ORF Transcript_23529/g.50820 Transcript_23529/m.50820 type:complete len:123 (-) Transcript_23529:15-383(-)